MLGKILLRKRTLIELVNDPLKNICQIERARHRSVFNFLVNLLSKLIEYSYQDKKSSLDLEVKDLPAFAFCSSLISSNYVWLG